MKKSGFKKMQYLFTLILLFWIIAIISNELFGYNLYQTVLFFTVLIYTILIISSVLGKPFWNRSTSGTIDILITLGFFLLLGAGFYFIESFGYTEFLLAFVVTPLLLVIIFRALVSGTPILKNGTVDNPCKEAVPELVAGYPKAEDNYKIGKKDSNKNILENIGGTAYDGINAWFGVVDEKFIDADISVRATYSHCVSAVECRIWDVGNKKYLNPFSLTYDSTEDVFKGNYVYQEKISLDDAEKESKKRVRNKYLKKLEKIAKKKGWKGAAKLLGRFIGVLAVIPNLPPELAIDQVNIRNISGITYPYPLEKTVDIPTYLPEKIEDIVFGLNNVN